MDLTEFSIRNYKPGYEQEQVKIFNERIPDLNPKARQITIEKVLKRHQTKSFHPEQVKYLVNKKNEIIGFAEIRILGTTHLIFYPLLVKEYDSDELRDYLFKAVYDYSVSLKPASIQGIYNFNFPKVHTYFENQNIAKIEQKYVRTEITINRDEIEKLTSLYKPELLKENEIEEVFAFFKKTDSLLKDVPLDQADELFEHESSPTSANSYLVRKEGRIVGFVTSGEFESEGKEKEHYTFMQDGIDKKEIQDIEIRKCFLKALVPFMKKHELKKLVLFVFDPSLGLTMYKEIGLQEHGYGRNIYSLKTKNSDKRIPFCNF